ASAPDADDESATAADRVPPPSAPRSWESDSPTSASGSVPRLAGHASASVLLAGRSQPHPRSPAGVHTASADSQTNPCSRWLRSQPPPAPPDPRRKPELARYAAAGARPTRPFLCPTLRSVGSSDESHSLYTSYTASFVSSSSVISKSSLLETVGGRCRHPIKPNSRLQGRNSGLRANNGCAARSRRLPGFHLIRSKVVWMDS